MLARLLPLGPADEGDLVNPITRRARQPHGRRERWAAPGEGQPPRELDKLLGENVQAAARQGKAKYPTASVLQCIMQV